MKYLTRLTLLDFVLLAAFVIVGTVWAGERFGASPSAAPQEADRTANAPPRPTAAEAIDAAVDAIVGADGVAFVDALLDVADAAAEAGNLEAMTAVMAFAEAFATGGDGAYEAAALRLEEMADDPIVGPLTRRMSAAFVSAIMALPQGPAPAGTEWAQVLVLPAGDGPFLGPLLGSVTWMLIADGTGIRGTLEIPDGPLTGTITIAPANAVGYAVDIVASFGGAIPLAPVARIDSVAAGDGTLAYDEPLEADLRIDGPWQISAGLWSATANNIAALREAETLAWNGVLADGGRFVIRLVLGDSGGLAIGDLLRTARL